MDTVGQRVAARRKALNMTQTALAKVIGVNRSTVSQYEHDIIKISTADFPKVADILKVKVSYLYGDTTLDQTMEQDALDRLQEENPELHEYHEKVAAQRQEAIDTFDKLNALSKVYALRMLHSLEGMSFPNIIRYPASNAPTKTSNKPNVG